MQLAIMQKFAKEIANIKPRWNLTLWSKLKIHHDYVECQVTLREYFRVVATMNCSYYPEWHGVLDLSYGETRKPHEGRGFGKIIRAACVVAAKRAGFKSVNQVSTYVHGATPRAKLKPPSAYIMNKLGFNAWNTTLNKNGRIMAVAYTLNLNKQNSIGPAQNILSPTRRRTAPPARSPNRRSPNRRSPNRSSP